MTDSFESSSPSRGIAAPSGSAPDTVVVYHGDHCRDGFGAAYAAWRALGDRAAYHSVYYQGNPENAAWPDWHGKHVVVVDYTLPVEIIDRVRREAKSLVQLDHHATAQENYTAAGKHGPDTLFDPTHSGAVLAWQHFFPDVEPPDFLKDIEDSDLWKFDRPNTIAFARGVLAYPLTFEAWQPFETPEGYAQVVREGHVLEAQWNRWLQEWGEGVQLGTLQGVPIAVSPGNSVFRSGLGNWLSREHGQWGLIWRHRNDGHEGVIQCSLRSNQKYGLPPCRDMARRYGGGGHDYASGFEWPNLATLMHETKTDWRPKPASGFQLLPAAPASEEEEAKEILVRLKKTLAQKGAHVQKRPNGEVGATLPVLKDPKHRRDAGQILLKQQQQVVAGILEEARVRPLDGNPGGATQAEVWTIPSLVAPVVRELFKQGHAQVNVYVPTAKGVQTQAFSATKIKMRVPVSRRRLR